MRLLVSVSNVQEATEALRGGADIIDAKDPSAGALGAVSTDVMAALAGVCPDHVLFTAALGDAVDTEDVERLSGIFVAGGTDFVKIGFAGSRSPERIQAMLTAAIRGAAQASARAGVIAVAYADAARIACAPAHVVADAAVAAGVVGVLLDTADKAGPGLRALMSLDAVAEWTEALRARGLLVALAGRLTIDDVDWLAPLDPDVVGVRGAACDGGRMGRTSAHLVSMLRARCGGEHPLEPVWPARSAAARA